MSGVPRRKVSSPKGRFSSRQERCASGVSPGTARSTSTSESASRILSVDAYRGLVIFLMLAEVLRSCAVSAALPESNFWKLVCAQQTHATWLGCTLHDLIQPSFYFLVGLGLFLSLHRRLSSGQTFAVLARHVAVRSLALIVLGMVLVSIHPRRWVWWFDDTLTQIGLAFPFAFLVAVRPKRDWLIALAVILGGYWLWFALWPVPAPGFDYVAVGVTPDWLQAHGLTGFAAHWQKSSNAAGAFDRWFLNLFPRDAPFVSDRDGLTTLNFIPSVGTMVLGLMAGDLLTSGKPATDTVRRLCIIGVVLICVGWLLGATGICPIVKAIWTPSWVLFSGGWCFLLLAVFYAGEALAGWTVAFFPLAVVGMNAIVAYTLSHVYPAFAFNSIRRVVGAGAFEVLGPTYEPVLYGTTILLSYWLVLYVLHRRRIFFRL
jgi:heparan-alpha-glucosaminide N-acetyltransferase